MDVKQHLTNQPSFCPVSQVSSPLPSLPPIHPHIPCPLQHPSTLNVNQQLQTLAVTPSPPPSPFPSPPSVFLPGHSGPGTVLVMNAAQGPCWSDACIFLQLCLMREREADFLYIFLFCSQPQVMSWSNEMSSLACVFSSLTLIGEGRNSAILVVLLPRAVGNCTVLLQMIGQMSLSQVNAANHRSSSSSSSSNHNHSSAVLQSSLTSAAAAAAHTKLTCTSAPTVNGLPPNVSQLLPSEWLASVAVS